MRRQHPPLPAPPTRQRLNQELLVVFLPGGVAHQHAAAGKTKRRRGRGGQRSAARGQRRRAMPATVPRRGQPSRPTRGSTAAPRGGRLHALLVVQRARGAAHHLKQVGDGVVVGALPRDVVVLQQDRAVRYRVAGRVVGHCSGSTQRAQCLRRPAGWRAGWQAACGHLQPPTTPNPPPPPPPPSSHPPTPQAPHLRAHDDRQVRRCGQPPAHGRRGHQHLRRAALKQ